MHAIACSDRVVAIKQKFKMVVATILYFLTVKSDSKIVSGMLLLVIVANLVQICAVATEIWPIS